MFAVMSRLSTAVTTGMGLQRDVRRMFGTAQAFGTVTVKAQAFMKNRIRGPQDGVHLMCLRSYGVTFVRVVG